MLCSGYILSVLGVYFSYVFSYIKKKLFKPKAITQYKYRYDFYIGDIQRMTKKKFLMSRDFDSLSEGNSFSYTYMKGYYQRHNIPIFVVRSKIDVDKMG